MRNEELLKKIGELAEKNLKQREKLNTSLEIAYEDIRNGNSELEFREVKAKAPPHTVCGIDGSRYIVPLQDNVFVIARAVAIRGKDNVNEKEIPPDITEEFKVTSNYYDENMIGNKSILLMLYLETSLIDRCSDADVILLDGPLVDPPVYYEDPHIEDFPDLSEYVVFRANTLAKKVESSVSVLGISKRFSQRFLINYLMMRGLKQVSRSTENFIVSMMFLKYRRERGILDRPIYLGPVNWNLSLKERRLDDLNSLEVAYGAYKRYFDGKGLEIFSYYYQKDFSSPIGRIDILARSEEEANSKMVFIDRWAMSGIREITIVNKLADDLSNVSKNESQRLISLYDLMLSKDLREEDLLLRKILKK